TFFPAEVWSHSIKKDGHAVGTVVTFLDISERKAIEKMKAEFISVMSHELKTPLTAMQASLGLLKSGMLHTHPEKAARMLELADANTRWLVNLITDIIDFERLQSGELNMQKEPFALDALICEAAEAIASAASASDVSVTVSSEKLQIHVDRRILQTLS